MKNKWFLWVAMLAVGISAYAGNVANLLPKPQHVVATGGSFRSNEVRLVKWMFTTVFVTLDGQKAVDGLVYSVEKPLLRNK